MRTKIKNMKETKALQSIQTLISNNEKVYKIIINDLNPEPCLALSHDDYYSNGLRTEHGQVVYDVCQHQTVNDYIKFLSCKRVCSILHLTYSTKTDNYFYSLFVYNNLARYVHYKSVNYGFTLENLHSIKSAYNTIADVPKYNLFNREKRVKKYIEKCTPKQRCCCIA